jgi:hypothetical protein
MWCVKYRSVYYYGVVYLLTTFCHNQFRYIFNTVCLNCVYFEQLICKNSFVSFLKTMLGRMKFIFLFRADCVDVYLHQDSNIGSYYKPTPVFSRIQFRKDETRV